MADPPHTGKTLDASWKAWLKENVDRGCSPPELVGILRKHGFSMKSIRDNMGSAFPYEAHRSREKLPRLVRKPVPGLQQFDTDLIELYTLDGFLATSECDELSEVISTRLRPSTVTIESNDKYFRTSRTCDLSLLLSPLADAVDARIAQTMGIRLEYSEGIQAQRYDVGQEFKAHTDYFEPYTPEYTEYAATRGNRTWTFMVYLNEGMRGGGTRFSAIGHTFQPRGQAVIWNNLRADGSPNADTLHSGEPVHEGHKIIITKWFRELGSGPMFYD